MKFNKTYSLFELQQLCCEPLYPFYGYVEESV